MTQSFSNSTAVSILNYWFDAVAMPAAPTAVYLALHSANPNRIGSNEVVDGGYARVNVTALYTPDADDTVIGNSADIVFGAAVGSYTATHWGLWRTLSGSADTDFIAQGQLETPLTVTAGKQARFVAGDLVIGLL